MDTNAANRKILAVSVGCLLQEAGFARVDKSVMGTMVEMLQSTISEVGRLAKGYSEVAYRSEPLVADIVLALADMGINYDGLHSYSGRANRSIVPAPQTQVDVKQPTVLQVGDRKAHMSHIPENLPSFPDTHTYIFTPTVKQPVTEYEAIREKSAQQKTDIQRALCKFLAKTQATDSLFLTEDKDYQLVTVDSSLATMNVDAIMPRDQVFEAELDVEVKVRRKPPPAKPIKQEQEEGGDTKPAKHDEQDTKGLEGAPPPPLNPFLRPVKPAKRKHVEQRSENPMQRMGQFEEPGGGNIFEPNYGDVTPLHGGVFRSPPLHPSDTSFSPDRLGSLHTNSTSFDSPYENRMMSPPNRVPGSSPPGFSSSSLGNNITKIKLGLGPRRKSSNNEESSNGGAPMDGMDQGFGDYGEFGQQGAQYPGEMEEEEEEGGEMPRFTVKLSKGLMDSPNSGDNSYPPN